MDHGIHKHKRGEKTRMHEREVAEDGGAEGMAYAYDGLGHGGAEVVYHVEEVAGVVEPGG